MSKCQVCRESVIRPFSDQKWNFIGKEYSLVECVSCGTVFTNPMPDDETLSKVYSNCFDYRWYQDHYQAKYKDSLIRLDEYKGLLGKRVLDFGGGVGYFSKAAESRGFISITYDPFKVKGDRAQGKWDTLVALHVLEHSNNLARTIKEIKELLMPGGNIILTVPNYASSGYKGLGMAWVWAQPPLLHIFHFNFEGLKKLLAYHGFANISASYHERWDANLYTDLKDVAFYRKLDSLWGDKYINRSSFLRRTAAKISSYFRYRGLIKALEGYSKGNSSYAELQVTATLAKK